MRRVEIDFEKYDAIIFDLDGTLVDSMWVWEAIDIEYLKRLGHELPDDLQKAIEGMSFTETAHYFKERFDISDSIEQIQKHWHELVLDKYKSEIKLKRGVREFLEAADKSNMAMGIATSNSRTLLEVAVESNGITKYFKNMATSCEVERGKPSPDIYLKVARELGYNPQRCLVFEDTHAGVIAAKKAGMNVIAVYDDLSKDYIREITLDADDYVMGFDYLDYQA